MNTKQSQNGQAVKPKARRMSGAETQTAKVVLSWIIITVTLLGSWEWAGKHGYLHPIFFSYPSAIWQALVQGVRGDLITHDLRYTLMAVFLGFAGASVAGIATAFLLAQSRFAQRVVGPFLVALNSLPRVALAPLFVMWFGIGLLSHLLMAASLTFFVVLANTSAGIEGIDQDHKLLARLQGASRWQTFRLFTIPSALPSIFVGLELGFIFGMLGTVSGEMIVGEHGLGVRLQKDAGMFNTAGYFATLFVLILISALLSIITQSLKRRLLKWQTMHVVHAAG